MALSFGSVISFFYICFVNQSNINTMATIVKKFDIISPDGFSFFIDYSDLFDSVEQAEDSFDVVKRRYLFQGYYSSVRFGRIPLDDLRDYCDIVEIEIHEDEE